MTQRWFVGLACMACLLTGGVFQPLRADDLVVGFEEMDFSPYGRPDAEKTFVGYVRAVLDAYAEARGHRLSFLVVPTKRLFSSFERGDVDLFGPDNPQWSLDSKGGAELYYSDVIVTAEDGFVVLPGRQDDLPGEGIQHIGTIFGVTVEPLFDEATRQRLVFDQTVRFDSIFKALLLGRVDAVYCNRATTEHVLGRLGEPTSSVAWSTTLPRFTSEFHISSPHRELIADFDRWLHGHREWIATTQIDFGVAPRSPEENEVGVPSATGHEP